MRQKHIPEPESPEPARPLDVRDWIIVAAIAGIFVFLPVVDRAMPGGYQWFLRAYSVSICILLLVWMTHGGARSPLWRWMPPFFPWGVILRSSAGRWAMVLILVAATMAGVIGTAMGWGVARTEIKLPGAPTR